MNHVAVSMLMFCMFVAQAQWGRLPSNDPSEECQLNMMTGMETCLKNHKVSSGSQMEDLYYLVNPMTGMQLSQMKLKPLSDSSDEDDTVCDTQTCDE